MRAICMCPIKNWLQYSPLWYSIFGNLAIVNFSIICDKLFVEICNTQVYTANVLLYTFKNNRIIGFLSVHGSLC